MVFSRYSSMGGDGIVPRYWLVQDVLCGGDETPGSLCILGDLPPGKHGRLIVVGADDERVRALELHRALPAPGEDVAQCQQGLNAFPVEAQPVREPEAERAVPAGERPRELPRHAPQARSED